MQNNFIDSCHFSLLKRIYTTLDNRNYFKLHFNKRLFVLVSKMFIKIWKFISLRNRANEQLKKNFVVRIAETLSVSRASSKSEFSGCRCSPMRKMVSDLSLSFHRRKKKLNLYSNGEYILQIKLYLASINNPRIKFPKVYIFNNRNPLWRTRE